MWLMLENDTFTFGELKVKDDFSKWQKCIKGEAKLVETTASGVKKVELKTGSEVFANLTIPQRDSPTLETKQDFTMDCGMCFEYGLYWLHKLN